jgi:hypothetical protein
MILRLTAKLGKKIGFMPTQTLAPEENPFADWVGNLFTAQRTQYIMVSNSASLYSIILPGKGITDDSEFIERTKESMDQFMRDDGLEFIFRRLVVPHLGTFQYSKAGNRRVLGSMNDLIYYAKVLLIQRQMSPSETALLINETPLSYLQDDRPRNCFTAMTPSDGNAGLNDIAMAKWMAISPTDRARIMESVWCGGCMGVTTIVDYQVQSAKKDLVLKGYCAKCGNEVARLVEGD